MTGKPNCPLCAGSARFEIQTQLVEIQGRPAAKNPRLWEHYWCPICAPDEWGERPGMAALLKAIKAHLDEIRIEGQTS